VYFLGLRLNTYIASALAIIGLVWFWRIQRRPDRENPEPAPDTAPAAADSAAEPDPPAGTAAGPGDAAPTPAHAQKPQESHDSESTHG
jgi:hypothetical protein